MWISKKKWDSLEKRVADLEGQVQSQPFLATEAIADRLKEILLEQISARFSDNLSESLRQQ